jgi:glucose/arabinose dehydrogenase
MYRYGTLVLAVLAALALSGSASAVTVTPVMTGLDNPRGLDFGADGGLYVAEGGRGGPGPPFRVVRGITQGYGATGAISRLVNGVQSKWLTGFPSMAPPSGAEAEGGPQDITFAGNQPFRGPGDAYITMGLGGLPAARAALGAAGEMMGKLWKFGFFGGLQEVADIAAYEGEVNPDGAQLDSNPYGVTVLPRGVAVVDAGGNAVLRVPGRNISTLATFGPRANPTPIGPPLVDAVPTAVARGPDGALYVSELTGVPFLTGFARIYRIDPDGTTAVYATGLTTVVDLAFASNGRLYALQHASCGPFFACPGSIVRVEASARIPWSTAGSAGLGA